MILNAIQAMEIGEALVDAAQDATRYGRDHVVVTIAGNQAAVSMVLDDSLSDFGYEPIFTIKAE